MGEKKRSQISFELLLVAAVFALAAVGAVIMYDAPAPQSVSEPAPTAEPEPEFTAPPLAEPTAAPSAAPEYSQTAVTIDGVYIGTLSSRQAAEQALEDAEAFFSSGLPVGASVSGGIANEVVLEPREGETELITADALLALLTGDATPLRVEHTVDVSTTHIVPFDTKTVRDTALLVGVRFYETVGRAGSEHTVERMTYVNGELTGAAAVETVTLVEAVDEVVRVGRLKVGKSAVPSARGGEKGRSAGELEFAWPVKGSVKLNFGGSKGGFHYGMDIVTSNNADVGASCAGVVVFARERGGYGLTVEVDHGDGFLTRYAQLSAISVSLGDTVAAGQVIGTLEAKGELHFELRIDGRAYNPRLYLN